MSAQPKEMILHAAETFANPVWKTMIDEHSEILFIESRNPDAKVVTFSAWDVAKAQFLWKDLRLEEDWWLTLGYASNGVVLFVHYEDTNNPDKKSVIAFDVRLKKILWWKSNFVVAYVHNDRVIGNDTKFGSRELALNIRSGETDICFENIASRENFPIVRPLQYFEHSDHFQTVKSFLERKCGISATQLVEYCEHCAMIIISAFTGQPELANYLIVFNSEGDIVLKEQLGENLKGIACDTFFILSGFLIFVKNKRELISYRFV